MKCPCGSTNPDCLSYSVPPEDPKLTQSCLEFTRTQGLTSSIGVYEQINTLSSFIDGTQVYGHSQEISDELRTFNNGQLKNSSDGYLPLSETDFACSAQANSPCFVAGESRTSENLALTSVHTLFMREHNRIANNLANINPIWSDEVHYLIFKHLLYKVLQMHDVSEKFILDFHIAHRDQRKK